MILHVHSSFGLKWLIEKNGLEIMEFKKSLNDIRAVFQILNGYTYKKTVTRNRLWNLITTLFLIAPFNVLGVVMSKILPQE